MSESPAAVIDAPAKLNLGLDILGKRPDGFHEIRSVMAMLELADTIVVRPGDPAMGTNITGVPTEDNLIARALERFREEAPGTPSLTWEVQKRIPEAAGLGGASSDAAATLFAANQLCGAPLESTALAAISASLGSDIPFFLGAPFAVVSGRGTDLQPLPPEALDILIVMPHVTIPGKTRTLYSMLEPEDFTDGSRTREVVHSLSAGSIPATSSLGNCFQRALASLVPAVSDLQLVLARSPGVRWGLSGAGPAHYALGSPEALDTAGWEIADRFEGRVTIIRTVTRMTPIACRLDSQGANT